MFRIKSILGLLILICFFFLIQSCLKEETDLTAYGDVLVQSVIQGDSVVYGICYYAYSWSKMKEVSLINNRDDTKILLDSLEGRYTFLYIPDSLEYTSAKPLRTKYDFTVKFDNGLYYNTYDILDSVFLAPAKIKACYFDSLSEKLIIEWEKNTTVDQYRILLENEKNEIVFQSNFLDVTQSSLRISENTSGWIDEKFPGEGKKFKVDIVAYLFEQVPTVFDMQSISIAESDFILWPLKNN